MFYRKSPKIPKQILFQKLEGLQTWEVDSFGYGCQPSACTAKKIWKTLFFTWVLKTLHHQEEEQGRLGAGSSRPAVLWKGVGQSRVAQIRGPWKNSHHLLVLHKLTEIHSRFQRNQDVSQHEHFPKKTLTSLENWVKL